MEQIVEGTYSSCQDAHCGKREPVKPGSAKECQEFREEAIRVPDICQSAYTAEASRPLLLFRSSRTTVHLSRCRIRRWRGRFRKVIYQLRSSSSLESSKADVNKENLQSQSFKRCCFTRRPDHLKERKDVASFPRGPASGFAKPTLPPLDPTWKAGNRLENEDQAREIPGRRAWLSWLSWQRGTVALPSC
jgi:hypothetical protein